MLRLLIRRAPHIVIACLILLMIMTENSPCNRLQHAALLSWPKPSQYQAAKEQRMPGQKSPNPVMKDVYDI